MSALVKIPQGSLPTIEAVGGEAGFFAAGDGMRMRYAHWPAAVAGAPTVLYLNGRTEFIEKNLDTVVALRDRGYQVWTVEWRGQGLSQRLLDDPHRGYIASYEDYLRDLTAFVDGVVAPAAPGTKILLAHSMGGHLALRYLHDRPDVFAAAVLSAPMVDIELGGFFSRLFATLLARVAVWTGQHTRYVPGAGGYGVDGHEFEDNRLTTDPQRFARQHDYLARRPELALGGLTLGWLDATIRSIEILRAPAYAAAITTPVLMARPRTDRIVSNAALEALCEAMPDCRTHEIVGAEHELLLERDELRDQFWQAFDTFVGQRAA